MKALSGGRIFVASLQEAEDLVRPEAMGAYARHGIAGVLTVAHDVRARCVSTLPHLSLPIEETVPTHPGWFELACRFAGIIQNPLLVHCHAGVNRSRVFAAAILHRVWYIDLDAAIRDADPPQGRCLDSMIACARTPLA